MFLVSGNLLAVSKKRIFLVEEAKIGQPLFKNKIFDLDENEERELCLENYVIKDVKYSPNVDSFYMLCRQERENNCAEENEKKTRIIVCFKVFEREVKIMCYQNVSRQVHEFEPDFHENFQVFAVTSKDVERVKLQTAEGQVSINPVRKRKSIFQSGRPLLFGSGNDFVNKKDIFFSQPKSAINSFKFDSKMEYFFINQDKTIKKYDFKTKSLVHVFEGHKSRITCFSFSEDSKLMFR